MYTGLCESTVVTGNVKPDLAAHDRYLMSSEVSNVSETGGTAWYDTPPVRNLCFPEMASGGH